MSFLSKSMIQVPVSLVFNPFPHKLWFIRVCSLLKSLWEKEKFLTTSVSILLESSLPCSLNLRLSFSYSLSFEKSKFVVWERFNGGFLTWTN